VRRWAAEVAEKNGREAGIVKRRKARIIEEPKARGEWGEAVHKRAVPFCAAPARVVTPELVRIVGHPVYYFGHLGLTCLFA